MTVRFKNITMLESGRKLLSGSRALQNYPSPAARLPGNLQHQTAAVYDDVGKAATPHEQERVKSTTQHNQMSLLTNHLLSLQASSSSISALNFPPPKIFTNALLHPTEITNLIRDTEVHERALFSVPPPPPSQVRPDYSDEPTQARGKRRRTVFNVQGGEVSASTAGSGVTGASRLGRKNTVVASVLGGELHHEIVVRPGREGKGKEVDVDILLHGVEKLLEVYPTEGARERVAAARRRKAELGANIERYSRLIGELENQSTSGTRRGDDVGDDESDGDVDGLARLENGQKRFGTMNDPWRNGEGGEGDVRRGRVTLAMVQAAQREVKELEMRKRRLEERVEGMGPAM